MKIGKLHLKKFIVIAIVAFILFSIFRYCVKNSIIDAAVNEQTGAITILNRDYELKTYDRYGNMIYGIKLLNTGGGYAHLDYEDGLLIVHVLRTDEVRKYDEEGNLTFCSKEGNFVAERIPFKIDCGSLLSFAKRVFTGRMQR